MKFKRIHMIYEVKKSEEKEESRILKFRGSDDTRDRVGDVMENTGWDVKNYKLNPVFLWAHDSHGLPIGKTTKLKITKTGPEFDVEFVPRDISPFADTVFKLYKGGFLSAVSVGFIPKEQNYDPKAGENRIIKKELLELSGVPIPCNPNALIMDGVKAAVSKGVINEQEAYEFGLSYKETQKKCDKCTLCKHDENNQKEIIDLSNKEFEVITHGGKVMIKSADELYNIEDTNYVDVINTKATPEEVIPEVPEEIKECKSVIDQILNSVEVPSETKSTNELAGMLSKLKDS